MTDGPSQKNPARGDRERETPLTLADSSEGSTIPVPEDDSVAGESVGSRGASAGSSSSPSPLDASASGPAGASTGGFETLLGKLVVRSGLATREEVDKCNEKIEASSGTDDPRTLPDELVRNDFVTQHQLHRLRSDFEAKKSPQHIPGYQITRKLGSGAMATVYQARQISLDRPVAIKILPKKFSDNERFIERFHKEGRSAAQLNHPNIVGAYDVGRAGEHHYFVMEYVDGSTVHDRIGKRKRIPEQDALEIVKQVARALEHAHSRGFVHRDIKPKNIMITRKGRVKLADLGLARAMSDKDAAKAEAGRAYGTPYYISPEQIRGEIKIGPPADLYGLGATFFHMVTGRVPFEGKNPSSVMHKHLKSPLEPPDHLNPEITAGTAQVIEMMMAKKVEERYHSATDLLEDLDLVARGEPPHFAHRTLDQEAITDTLTDVAAATPVVVNDPAPNAADWRRNPILMAMTGAVVVCVLVIIILIILLIG